MPSRNHAAVFKKAAWSSPEELDGYVRANQDISDSGLRQLFEVMAQRSAKLTHGQRGATEKVLRDLAATRSDAALAPDLIVLAPQADERALRLLAEVLIGLRKDARWHLQLFPLLADADPHVRGFADQVLSRVGGKTLLARIDETAAEAWTSRLEVMHTLVEVAGHYAIPVLMKMLPACAREERTRIVQLLADERYMKAARVEACQALRGLLSHEDPRVRGRAAGGLGQWQDESAIGPITELVWDENRWVARAAVAALAGIASPEAIETIGDVSRIDNIEIQTACVDGLVAIGTDAVVSDLVRLLESEILVLRNKAGEGLSALGRSGKVDLARMIAYQKDSAAVFKQVMREDFGYEETTRRMADRRRRAETQDGDLEAFPELAEAPAERPGAPPVADGERASPGGAQLADGDADTWTGAARDGVDAASAALVRLEPGMHLGDRHELLHRIGAGGRGVVFAARDLELDETVALKVLHPTDVSEESLVRFRQELKLARKLTHRNIIRVHDIGEVDGLRFITMEYLDGHDLEQAIRASPGTFPIATGVDYARQICDGLGAAHDLGIIHRDIKPPNVMVVEPGTIKILDFGIAKAVDVQGISATGMACGTPLYMSPEQIRGGRALDPRTDLYSLGCVLFVLFTGKVPFTGDEVFELLMAHINEPPPRPRDLRGDMPRDLEGIILRLLAKSPGDRYSSAEELRAALDTVG